MTITTIEAPSEAAGPCGCMASEHEFLLNCQHCGRLICVQESRDVCYACGSDPKTMPAKNNPVATFFGPNELANSVKNNNKETDGSQTSDSDALRAAIERRDRILQQQALGDSQLKVIDEQHDYYDTSAWMTEEDHAEAEKQREAAKKAEAEANDHSTYRVHLDIMNQNIAVCSNIRSSLEGGGLPELKAGAIDLSLPMAGQAAQRAMDRLTISAKAVDDSEINRKAADVLRPLRNPSVQLDGIPQLALSVEKMRQAAARSISAKEMAAVERKMAELKNKPKVQLDIKDRIE